MNQEEYEEQLKMAGEFHGEICGGIAIGTIVFQKIKFIFLYIILIYF